MFFIFTILKSLRSIDVGTDTELYKRMFNEIGTRPSLFFGEGAMDEISAPVYITIARLSYALSSHFNVFMFVTSVIITYGLIAFIKKTSYDYCLSIFCWSGLIFFITSMNLNRQFLAVTLMINAIVYFSKSLLSLKGWALAGIALSIHGTGILALSALGGIVLSKKIKNDKILFAIAVVAGTAVSVLYRFAISVFAMIFPRFEMYLDSSFEFYIFGEIGGGRIIFLYLLLFAICTLWILSSKSEDDDIYDFNRKILPIATFGTVFGIFNADMILMNRVIIYLTVFHISLIPAVVNKYKGVVRYAIYFGIIIALMLYYYIALRDNHSGVIPYNFFWQV